MLIEKSYEECTESGVTICTRDAGITPFLWSLSKWLHKKLKVVMMTISPLTEDII